jgi:ankyrin repeat protein/uncharacterized protein YegL
MSSNPLLCPISMDIMEDPITLSCGHSFDRDSILSLIDIDIADGNDTTMCPICRAIIVDNVETMPKNYTLLTLIEQQKNNENKTIVIEEVVEVIEQEKIDEKKTPRLTTEKWNVECLNLVKDDDIYSTPIKKIEIKCYDEEVINSSKTLLLLVVDSSGSMSGSPINQVNFALKSIFSSIKKNESIKSFIIDYNSNATIINDYTSPIVCRGGTNFKCAFDAIIQKIKEEKTKEIIKNTFVMFMTDGQDGSGMDKVKMIDLFSEELKESVESSVVHTIGFSRDHDFDFLNKIKESGTISGTFRFADPSESEDALYGKIMNVASQIINSNIISLKLQINDTIYDTIMKKDTIIQWINEEDIKKISIIVNDIEYNISKFDMIDTYDFKYFLEWYSILTEQLIGDIIDYKKSSVSGEDFIIFGELLKRRCHGIIYQLENAPYEVDKCDSEITADDILSKIKYAMETIDTIMSGKTVDMMKFTSSQYDKKIVKKTENIPNKNNSIDSHIIMGISRTEPLKIVNDLIPPHIPPWDSDDIENNPLHKYCAEGSIKNRETNRDNVKETIKSHPEYINEKNKNGLTPLDCAIVYYGFYDSVQELVNMKAQSSFVEKCEQRKLLKYLLDRGWIITASVLCNANYIYPSKGDDDIYECPDRKYNDKLKSWIRMNMKINDDDMNKLIIKNGMVESLDKLKLTKYDFGEIPELFKNLTTNHLKVIDYLIKNKIADVDDYFEYNGEKTNLIFLASQIGNIRLLRYVLRISKKNLDFVNSKGNDALWVASGNSNVDIIGTLIKHGAIPRKNIKGDNPLVPACQKGLIDNVKILISAGANICDVNVKGDSVIILCCRNGQADILDYMLEKLSDEERDIELKQTSGIDGLNPLFASAELNRASCISVLYKCVDLEQYSDNEIIKGAQASHLCAHYGRLEALKTLEFKGVDLNAQTKDTGNTPLHIAIKNKHIEMARYLMKNKHIKHLKNYEGKLPVYYAKTEGNEELYYELFYNKFDDLIIKRLGSGMTHELFTLLNRYGSSLGCYNFSEILNYEIREGFTLASYGYLTRDKYLIEMADSMNINNKWIQIYKGNPEKDDHLEKVISKLNKDYQTKLLLDISDIKNPSSITNENLFDDKMNSGEIVTESIDDIIEISDEIEPVADFKNKLSKLLKISEEKTIQIIFDAQITTINSLINNHEIDMDIVYTYCLSLLSNETFFKELNNQIKDYDSFGEWSGYISNVYNALTILPSYTGECYRKINKFFYMPEGTVIAWDVFGIATSDWGNIGLDSKATVFIIKSKTGKDISKYSNFPQNKEIIFMPKTKFKITNYYRNNIIVLGQANVRETSYKAREEDLLNVLNKKSSLIVELEEV